SKQSPGSAFGLAGERVRCLFSSTLILSSRLLRWVGGDKIWRAGGRRQAPADCRGCDEGGSAESISRHARSARKKRSVLTATAAIPRAREILFRVISPRL